MARHYNISTAGVPVVVIGDVALVGETPIRTSLEERIIIERGRGASCNGTVPSGIPPEECSTPAALTPLAVIVPALADSLNPCALAVLIFLLIPLSAVADRRRILLTGSAYIAAVFLFHLLVGIGIFSMVSLSGFAQPFALFGAGIAILLGVVTLADLLRNRETFLLSIPESGKGILSQYIRAATLPAAFILGLLAGLLGFSCTGGIYISILALMGRSVTVSAGLPWLLLYNIVFILPLAVVTLFVAYGASPEQADAWRTLHRRELRLVIAFIMITLGLVILLGWLG